MAELKTLESLETLHKDLLACSDGYMRFPEALGVKEIVAIFERELSKIWNKPPKSEKEREGIKKG